jgi:hypothetical protein
MNISIFKPKLQYNQIQSIHTFVATNCYIYNKDES